MSNTLGHLEKKPSIALLSLAFLAIYIIWGSTYLFVAFAVEEVPPLMMASIRFLIASSIIYILSPLFIDWKSVTKKQVINAIQAGFYFLVLGNGAMTYALQYVDTGFSSLLISSSPLVLLFLMYIIDKTPIKPMSIIGICLGLIGMYLLVNQKEIVYQENQWKGILAIISCLFTWGYGSLHVAKSDMPKSHFVNATIQMSFGGIVLLMGSYAFGEAHVELLELKKITWISILYLSIFGSIFAFTAFNFLLKHISPEKVATSAYINPIVAIALGWYFRNEIVTQQTIIAACILLTGVYFINVNKSKINTSKNA